MIGCITASGWPQATVAEQGSSVGADQFESGSFAEDLRLDCPVEIASQFHPLTPEPQPPVIGTVYSSIVPFKEMPLLK